MRRGEVFALLGPNGAGKTTTTEILEGLRSWDGGEVEVLGSDPAAPTRSWREPLGVVPQTSRPEPELTVAESLELCAGYYPAPQTVEDVIEDSPRSGRQS